MKKQFIMAAAAILTLGMVGCDKNPGGDPAAKDGDKGALQLTIAIPNGTSTRSTTGVPGNDANNGSEIATATGESTIVDVTIYAFTTNGVKLATGGVKTVAIADFDQGTGPAANQYTMKSAYDVTSGDARIYVGVNVPTAWKEAAGGFASEAALLAATGTIGTGVTADNQLDAAAAMTMFSAATTTTLAAYNADTDNVNNVDVTVGRVASKVVATSANASYAATAWANGVTLTYTLDGYNVYNEAAASYLAAKTDGTTLSDPIRTFDESYAKGAQSPANGNKAVKVGANYVFANVALSDLAADYFIAENNSSLIAGDGGLSRNGTTTYAMVSTTVVASKTVQLNGEVLEWTGAANSGTEDLWILRKDGATYIVKGTDATAANLAAIQAKLGAGTVTYHYPAAHVHFLVWLNKEGTNDYNIGRNEFIHLEVTGVAGIDGVFPGYPGDPEDPDKPIDPTEEDPNNPDPIDPDDPVDPLAAKLKVKVTVTPWIYRHNAAVLQ